MLFFSLTSRAETVHIATGEYPPWTSASLPHGGYINHIVSSAFKESGINIELHYLPWKRALEATRIGKYHATSFWSESEERKKDFLHSDIINDASFVFFYNKSNAGFSWCTLGELSQYKIGATRGYTYTKEFWALIDKDVLRASIANGDVQSLKKLVQGKIDLFPISELTGHYLLNQHFTDDERQQVSVYSKPLSNGKDFILFSKELPKNTRFLKAFNEGFMQLVKQKKIEQFQ